MLPKVSIIIPVYNSEQYIEACLKSVLTQSFEDFEVICIDDGSIDNSLKILQNYGAMDSRIKIYINESNKGAGQSRNCGISHACGEYIYFMDSDDCITENAMEELYKHSILNDLDLCYFKLRIQNMTKPGLREGKANEGIVNSYPQIYNGIKLLNLFLDNQEFFYYPVIAFYKHDFIKSEKLKFGDLLIGEGGLFAIQAILQAERVAVLDKELYIYCLRERSVTTSNDDYSIVIYGQFIQYIEVLKKVCSETDPRVSDILKKFLDYQLGKIRGKILGSVELSEKVYQKLQTAFERHIFQNITMQNKLFFKDFSKDQLKAIRNTKNIFIYGVGCATLDVLSSLSECNLEILGFVVTNKKYNPPTIYGHHVYSIDEILEYSDNALVIIAADRKYNDQIVETLTNLCFENYLLLDIKI